MKTPFMIGLAGGTASGEEGLMMMMMMMMMMMTITLMSGKSTVAATLMRALGQNQYSDDGQKEVDSRHMVQHHDAGSRVLQVVTLSQDSFYRELSEQEIARAERGLFNFDHPDAFDWDLMEEVLSVSLAVDTDIATNYSVQKILSGQAVQVPVYDFKTHSRVVGEVVVIQVEAVVVIMMMVTTVPRPGTRWSWWRASWSSTSPGSGACSTSSSSWTRTRTPASPGYYDIVIVMMTAVATSPFWSAAKVSTNQSKL